MTTTAPQFSPAILIRASAGAGKTYCLTSQIIQLLALGEKPERIVAATFTRKAAGEIAWRLFQRLSAAALNPEEADKLSKSCSNCKIDCRLALDILSRLINRQHCLNICTLDSLFVQIAQSFSLELGLPLEWRIINPEEEETVQTTAISALLSGNARDTIAELLKLINKGRSKRSVHQAVSQGISSLHSLFLETDYDNWSWLDFPDELNAEVIARIIDDLTAVEVPRTKKGLVDKRFQSALEKCIQTIRDGQWEYLISTGLSKKVLAQDYRYYNVEICSEIINLINQATIQAQAVLLRQLRDRTASSFGLAAFYDQHYTQTKIAKSCLSFDDIKYRLARSANDYKLVDLYYRLDTQVHHLLLDEFQDTAVDQWKVLQPIADEILSQPSLERSFFCVGDTKQAIYAWRRGEAAIFDSLESRYPQLDVRHLEQSYRSAKTVIELVNQIFENLPSNAALSQYGTLGKEWAAQYIKHKTVHQEEEGYLQFQLCSETAQNQESNGVTDDIFRQTAKLIEDIVTKAPLASVGVLLRENKTVSRMIYELRRPEINIEASEEGGTAFADSPAALLLLSLLLLADHTADKIAVYHVANSPLGRLYGITTDLNQANVKFAAHNIREELLRDGYGDVIARWIDTLAPHLEQSELERLDRLLDYTLAYSSKATLRPKDFVRLVKSAHAEDARRAQVRVMTIHKAKGLEFDVVVLPDLSGLLHGKRPPEVICYRPDPLSAPTHVSCSAKREIYQLHPMLKQMEEQRKAAAVKESLNLLYVALTRARSAIYMLVSQKIAASDSIPNTFAGVLAYGLTGIEDPKELESFLSGGPITGGDPDWHSRFSEKAAETDRLSPESVIDSFSFKDSGQPRSFSRKTPSSLEGGSEVPASTVLRFSNHDALLQGLLIHLLFEQVGWIEEGIPEESLLLKVLLSKCPDRALCQRVLDKFNELLKFDKVRYLLSKDTYCAANCNEVKLFRELPFAYRQENTIVSGTIDRLVITLDQTGQAGVDIIDFKTDYLSDQTSFRLEDKVVFYRPQLLAYRKIAAKIAMTSESCVSCKLLFVIANEIVEVAADSYKVLAYDPK